MILLHSLDRVGARRVDDVEVAQHIERIVVELEMRTDGLRRSRFPVTENGDRPRRRKVSHREDLVAEERVDESALAAVVLADDDEQKELVHLIDE